MLPANKIRASTRVTKKPNYSNDPADFPILESPSSKEKTSKLPKTKKPRKPKPVVFDNPYDSTIDKVIKSKQAVSAAHISKLEIPSSISQISPTSQIEQSSISTTPKQTKKKTKNAQIDLNRFLNADNLSNLNAYVIPKIKVTPPPPNSKIPIRSASENFDNLSQETQGILQVSTPDYVISSPLLDSAEITQCTHDTSPVLITDISPCLVSATMASESEKPMDGVTEQGSVGPVQSGTSLPTPIPPSSQNAQELTAQKSDSGFGSSPSSLVQPSQQPVVYNDVTHPPVTSATGQVCQATSAGTVVSQTSTIGFDGSMGLNGQANSTPQLVQTSQSGLNGSSGQLGQTDHGTQQQPQSQIGQSAQGHSNPTTGLSLGAQANRSSDQGSGPTPIQNWLIGTTQSTVSANASQNAAASSAQQTVYYSPYTCEELGFNVQPPQDVTSRKRPASEMSASNIYKHLAKLQKDTKNLALLNNANAKQGMANWLKIIGHGLDPVPAPEVMIKLLKDVMRLLNAPPRLLDTPDSVIYVCFGNPEIYASGKKDHFGNVLIAPKNLAIFYQLPNQEMLRHAMGNLKLLKNNVQSQFGWNKLAIKKVLTNQEQHMSKYTLTLKRIIDNMLNGGLQRPQYLMNCKYTKTYGSAGEHLMFVFPNPVGGFDRQTKVFYNKFHRHELTRDFVRNPELQMMEQPIEATLQPEFMSHLDIDFAAEAQKSGVIMEPITEAVNVKVPDFVLPSQTKRIPNVQSVYNPRQMRPQYTQQGGNRFPQQYNQHQYQQTQYNQQSNANFTPMQPRVQQQHVPQFAPPNQASQFSQSSQAIIPQNQLPLQYVQAVQSGQQQQPQPLSIPQQQQQPNQQQQQIPVSMQQQQTNPQYQMQSQQQLNAYTNNAYALQDINRQMAAAESQIIANGRFDLNAMNQAPPIRQVTPATNQYYNNQ